MKELPAALDGRLENLSAHSTGWTAKCPSHDDNHNSLSINVSKETGNTLLNCKVGCEFRQIVADLGLSTSALFAPGSVSRKKVVATYPYVDEDGKLLYEVLRYEPKAFSQRAADGTRSTAGIRKVLYRLPRVLEAIESGDTIFLCEGEKDVASVEELGLVATTNDGGAAHWRPGHTEVLSRAARVVILPDNDDAGRKRSAALLKLLPNAVDLPLPGLAEKGDVSDWIAAGGTADQLLELADNPPVPADRIGAAPAKVRERSGMLTDLGNAEALVADHGDILRYVFPWKTWLIWDGTRWAKDEMDGIVRLAKQTVRKMYTEASGLDTDRRSALVKHAMRSEASGRLHAMVELARAEPGVGILPKELDADPWVVNLKNGILDLRTGKLGPHDQAKLCVKRMEVEYDPGAECPLWEAFLRRIFDGKAELIEFMQRVAGYSLTGSIREQCIFILHGSGANGKSVFLETLRGLWGDYSEQSDPKTFQEKKQESISNDVAALKGARLVAATETESGGRLSETLVKQATGGEDVTARFLHQEFFSYKPEFKLFLVTNHRPIIRGSDNGIWRRIRLVPFEVTIPEAERDKDLMEKLRAELPGILAWTVRGCAAWLAGGLAAPEAVTVATSGYREEMDILGPFIKSACRPEGAVAFKELWAAYVDFCSYAHEEPMKQRTFSEALAERGFRKEQNKLGQRVWGGIRLATPTERAAADLEARKQANDVREKSAFGQTMSSGNLLSQTMSSGEECPHELAMFDGVSRVCGTCKVALPNVKSFPSR